MKVGASVLGVVLAGGAAFGATNWIVGLSAGSSGQAPVRQHLQPDDQCRGLARPHQSSLSGGHGRRGGHDQQPQPLPGDHHRAAVAHQHHLCHGVHHKRTATTTQTGCLATTPSDVIWNYSTTTSGSSHTLTSAVTVGASGAANNPLVVTFTNDASMTAAAPAACANTYFSDAVVDRGHRHRRIRHVHHDPGHGRLDQLTGPL